MSSSWLARLVVAAVAFGVMSVGWAQPADAVTRETFVVSGMEAISKDFGPIPGNFPLTTAVNWTPPGCQDGGPGSTQCDKIPVKVVPPEGIGPADDWYVIFEVTWDHRDGVNDLDVYLWDNGQIQQENGSSGYTRLDQSASAGHPESVKLFAPMRDLYNITVLNWSGPNLGYTITAQMFVSPFERPFEVLAPEFSGSSRDDDFSSEESAAPFDFSAEPPAGAPAPSPPTFGEVAITGDDDFAEFAPSDFDQQLAAPPVRSPVDPRFTSRPPKAVPALVALFWFAVVPLTLIAAAAALLIRHSRNQLSLA